MLTRRLHWLAGPCGRRIVNSGSISPGRGWLSLIRTLAANSVRVRKIDDESLARIRAAAAISAYDQQVSADFHSHVVDDRGCADCALREWHPVPNVRDRTLKSGVGPVLKIP